MFKLKVSVFFLGFLLAIQTSAWAATYQLDKTHTTVGFKIKHLLSWVRGTFNEFEGTIEYDPANPAIWQVSATVQAASIDTGVEARDKHLRSKDFFDVDTYPTLTFKSTEVTEASANAAKLHGLISIHGVEKPVVFNLEIHGIAQDPWGNERAGFTATTTINRSDFGLTWNQALETGGVLVGDEVMITIDVEGIKA